MGSKAIKNLGKKNSWAFIGIKAMKKSVEQTGVTSEFGTVLSYTKVVRKAKKVEKVEGGSKIQALSQVNPGAVRVVINDVDVLKAEDVKPGFNIVVLAGANHEVMFVKNYNTVASKYAKAEGKCRRADGTFDNNKIGVMSEEQCQKACSDDPKCTANLVSPKNKECYIYTNGQYSANG